MRLDLHCPIELCSYELAHDDRGRTRAYFKLRNLSSRRICRFEAILYLTQKDGRQSAQALNAQGFDGPGRSVFSLSAGLDEALQVCALEMVFMQVFFEGEDKPWKGRPDRLMDIPSPQVPAGAEMNRLIQAVGSDAVCYPQQEESYWLCVCGRPNPFRRKTCLRCGRDRQWLFDNCTPQQLKRLFPKPSAPQANLPLQDEERAPAQAPKKQSRKERGAIRRQSDAAQLQKRFARQRSLLMRRTLTMLIIALALAAVALFAGSCRQNAQPAQSIPPVLIQNQPAV